MTMVGGGGAYLQDKNTCARTSTENVGGLICEGGIYTGRYGTSVQKQLSSISIIISKYEN